MIAAVRTVWGSLSAKHRPADPAPPCIAVEARAAPRHELAVEGRFCLVGTEHRCMIRNVSTGGMIVSSPTAVVCTGQQVIIDTEQMGSLYGIVRWFREGSFGVQFQTPMALDRLNHACQSASKGMQPRAGRARVSMPAVAHYGQLSRQVMVGNIAVGGLMMTTRLPMRPAQSVMIEFSDMLPIGGHVRWAEPDRCGVMFTRLMPIPAAIEIARRASLGTAWLDDVRAAHDQANA